MDGHNIHVVKSFAGRWLAGCDRCELEHECLDRGHALRTVRALHVAREADRAAETRRAVEHDLGIKLGGRS